MTDEALSSANSGRRDAASAAAGGATVAAAGGAPGAVAPEEKPAAAAGSSRAGGFLPVVRRWARGSQRARNFAEWGCIALVAIAIFAMIFGGISYRRWAWDFTDIARFEGDLKRNFDFGKAAGRDGLLNMFENQIRDDPPRDLKFDYPPLRLAAFEAWARWMQWRHPEMRTWNRSYAFNAPLMRCYTAMELLGAFAGFLVVLYWRRQCALADCAADVPRPEPLDAKPRIALHTGLLAATLAFALLWFDPGIVIIAHGWPSPNMWAIPFYLWTVLLCLCDWWFVAGLLAGIGVMAQGQQLAVAGIFVLWPLFAGRPSRALRWVSGFALTFMLIVSGWMLTLRPDIQLPARVIHWSAVLWVGGSPLLLALVGLRRALLPRVLPARLGKWWGPGIAGAAVIWLIWPAFLSRDPLTIALTSAGALLLVGLFWHCNWSANRFLLPLSLAACLLMCVRFFGASTAWWQVGFVYGSERFPSVGGIGANNLPALLDSLLGWHDIHDTALVIPRAFFLHWPAKPIPVNVRVLLLWVFAILFIAGAAAVARQWRRRDRKLLVALALPWMLFYTILPQMSPRYPVFVAVSLICIGQSYGMTLLALLFSFLTVAQTAQCMGGGRTLPTDWTINPLFNTQMMSFFQGISPGISWAEVLAAGVFFYVAFTGARRVSRRKRADINQRT
jgi:hypothetical protein